MGCLFFSTRQKTFTGIVDSTLLGAEVESQTTSTGLGTKAATLIVSGPGISRVTAHKLARDYFLHESAAKLRFYHLRFVNSLTDEFWSYSIDLPAEDTNLTGLEASTRKSWALTD